MKKIALALCGVAILFACTKKNEKEEKKEKETIEGRYLVVSTPLSGNYKYLEIDATAFRLYGRVNDETHKIRQRPYNQQKELAGDSLKIDGVGFKISWDAKTLTLQNAQNKYVLLKDESAMPLNEWYKTLKVEKLIDNDVFVKNGGAITDMTYANGYVYTCGHTNLSGKYVISRFTPSTMERTEMEIPTSSTTSLGYSRNIEHMGESGFWTQERAQSNTVLVLTRHHSTTLEKTLTYTNPQKIDNSNSTYFLTSNADKSVLYAGFYDGIAKYNFIDQKWGPLRTLAKAGWSETACINGDHMYVASSEAIYKVKLSSLVCEEAYHLDGDLKIQSIESTSTNNVFLANAYSYTSKKYSMFKITLP